MNFRLATTASFFFLAAGFARGATGVSAQDAPASFNVIKVSHGWTRETPRPGIAVPGFFTIDNPTDMQDVLDSVDCPIARVTRLIGPGGTTVGELPIKPGQKAILSAKTVHLVLEQPKFQLYRTALIPCSLHFQNAGPVMLYLEVEPKDATAYRDGDQH